jgi:hypothetical protein
MKAMPRRLPRLVNPYMRHALALHALETERDDLDTQVARAMKHLERLPEHKTKKRARWQKVSEDAMARLALLQHNVAAEAREIALREGRAS